VLGSIVTRLPDAAFALTRDVQRAVTRTLQVSTTIAVATAAGVTDRFGGIPPVHATVRAVDRWLAPVQARGSAERTAQVHRLAQTRGRAVSALERSMAFVVDRLPVERLIARIPFDQVLASIDIEALLTRIDIGRLVNEALQGLELGELMRESTRSGAEELRDVGRAEAMRADLAISRIVDRVLRRQGRDLDVGGLATRPAL
jgi:hypothetical protein